jgi:nitroimidazol reductase NimA-like FMN-containing flavoprotein (pyridoxamine 5'-phosphate oxidase superfamily)
MRLLAASTVGRIALDTGHGPVIAVVVFALDGSNVVFRTDEDDVLGLAALWGRQVAFQADEIDVQRHEGWSVAISGELRSASDADARRLIDIVHPWVEGEHRVVGVVIPSSVSGRRLVHASG